MPIPRFYATFDAAVRAMQDAADKLRYLAASSGAMNASVIFADIPNALAEAKATAVAALTECSKNPASATEALGSFPGAPQTVASFLSAVTAVETAAQSWNADVAAWLAGLTVADLVALQGVNRGAGMVAQFVWATSFPDAKVAPLRKSTGLASLIAAFEAAGATP